MPVVTFSKKELSLNDRIAEARKDFWNTFIDIGSAEDIEDSEREEIDWKLLRIINNRIIYLSRESKPHRQSCFEFGKIFSDFSRSQEEIYSIIISTPIHNQYSCGSVHEKVPDAALIWRDSGVHLVDLEIAFGHESAFMLAQELANYLTPSTTALYSIGLYFDRSSINFNCHFYILERMDDQDTELRQKVLSFYTYKSAGKQFPDLPCLKIDENSFSLTSDFFRTMNSRLIYYKNINESNYQESFVFYLDLPITESFLERRSRFPFFVSGIAIRNIRQAYRNWYQEFRN